MAKRINQPPAGSSRLWLQSLGISSMRQWDVLVFLHRHDASLLGAEQIAKLLGYETADVLAALESLYAHHLLKQSRPSNGARLYQFCHGSLEDPLRHAFDGLMSLASSRSGRLDMVKFLRKTESRGSINQVNNVHWIRHSEVCPAGKESEPWLKAS